MCYRYRHYPLHSQMRLLNTRTGWFEEKNPEQITYAILSHTWDEIEQTFQDVREIQRSYDEHGRLLYWRLLPEVTQRAFYAGRHVGRAFIRLTSVASAYEVLRIGIRRYMRSPRQESPSLRVHPSSDGRFSGISRRTIPPPYVDMARPSTVLESEGSMCGCTRKRLRLPLD